MAEYYFDIETYSPGDRPNPDTDEIITIQFQRIDLRTGKPIGDLEILKAWESSEEAIVKSFYERFFAPGKSCWDFVPVGFNLQFEWEFLIAKFEKHIGKKMTSRELHYKIPHLDLKPILVLLNNGSFKGATLSKFTSKPEDGNVIKGYYENKDFQKIEKYIEEETKGFLEFLEKIKTNIGRLIE